MIRKCDTDVFVLWGGIMSNHDKIQAVNMGGAGLSG